MPQRLAMVRAVAARLASASTVDAVADATLVAAGQFLDAVTSSVWLVNRTNGSLEMRYETNAHPDAVARFATVPLGADLPGPRVLMTGEACFAESREERDRLWPLIAGTPTLSEAMVVLPLEVSGDRIGVVSFGFATPQSFESDDRVALLAIADQCAIALDRARLYEAERGRAEAQTLLARISGAVGPTMDWTALARYAVAACTEDLADLCVLYVREGHLVRRVALSSRSDPRLEAALVDHYPTPLNATTANAVAIRTGQASVVEPMRPNVVPDASPAPGYAETVRRVVTGPGWIFPLKDRGTTFGSMAFMASAGHELTGAARELARVAAERTANVLVSASAFAEQRAALAALHEVVLPGEIVEIAGLEIAARYVPLARTGALGGDWWDALALPGGKIGLAIGDVAGHGVPSAAVMGQVRNALRMELVSGHEPSAAMLALSGFLDWTHPLAHCTAIAATISPETGTVTWSSAGHPPPLLIGADGEATFLHEPASPPLGVVGRRAVGYHTHTTELAPGATLILYTDGLVEGRTRSIDDGLAALARVATAPGPTEPLQNLSDLVLAGLVDRPEDDVCLVAVRWKDGILSR